MKRLVSFILAGILMVCCTATAAAQTQTKATLLRSIPSTITIFLQDAPNLVPVRHNNEYSLMNAYGEIVTDQNYKMISTTTGLSPYFRCELLNASAPNNQGILNGKGKLISTRPYADAVKLFERWTLGVVKDVNNKVLYADVYYLDNLVGLLSPEEYGTDHLAFSAHGDFLYLDYGRTVISATGERYTNTSSDYSRHDEYGITSSNRLASIYTHWGTGQKAFTPSCTLTSDQVFCPVLFDGSSRFIDLQGNVMFSAKVDGFFQEHLLQIAQEKYIVLDRYDAFYMFDLQGNIICSGSDIAGYQASDFMASGYQLYADHEGYLHYVDSTGKETSDLSLMITPEIKNEIMLSNRPFIALQDEKTGMYTVYTALAGKLPLQYDYVYYAPEGACVLGVARKGKVGVIDLYGNTVIDFKYDYFDSTYDGSIVLMKTNKPSWVYDAYRIDYPDPAAVEAERLAAEEAARAEAARLEQERIAREEAERLAAEEAAQAEAARLEQERIARQEAERRAAEEAKRIEEERIAKEEAERLAAEEAAKAIWHCDPCNRDNDMNFCPSCGVAKPVKLVCSGCGYEPEDQTFRFCPSCGQQF